ncbi:MAG: FAD-binding oxidoreductase [Mycobacteriales bacterium]
MQAALVSAVGAEHVLTDPDLRASYETDWTGRWRGSCRAVVRPGSTGEVAAVLAACAEAGVPVVPQGGNTGLVGGSVPVGVPRAVVLSTRRLDALGPVDAAGTVVVGAGATLGAVQRHARAAGWALGLDFASRDSATVGGAMATNAGGLRVLRWGAARAQLVGAEAVLASGAVLSRVDGPVKDSTGYDLSGLLCGSEGTLGVLTRVRLRLVPPLPDPRAVALVGIETVAAAGTLLTAVRRRLPGLAAAELIGAAALALAIRQGVPDPLPAPWPAYVLLEAVGAGALDDLTAALADAAEVGDAVLAADAADRARLWRCREELTPSISAAGVPIKLDVSVPAQALPAVWEALPGLLPRGAEMILFGHLAEATLHVNMLSVPAADGDAVTGAVLRLVAGAGGSISAEHGIGRAKARWLGLARSPAEVAAMRAVKTALDPAGLLNPNVLLAGS